MGQSESIHASICFKTGFLAIRVASADRWTYGYDGRTVGSRDIASLYEEICFVRILFSALCMGSPLPTILEIRDLSERT